MPDGAQVQQQPPEETRPARTMVPALTLETTLARAGQAFDNALADLIRSPPPDSEMGRLERLVNRSGDLTGSLESYVESNPNSVIAKYYHLGGEASDWLIVREEGRSVFGFNQDVLLTDLKRFFGLTRTRFLAVVTQLYGKEWRQSLPLEGTEKISGFYAAIPNLLSDALTSQLSSSSINLPITVAYDADSSKIVVTWEREAPSPDYSAEEMTEEEQRQRGQQ